MEIKTGSSKTDAFEAARKLCPLLTLDSLNRSRGMVFKAALTDGGRSLVFEHLPGESDGKGNVHDDMSVPAHEDNAVIGWIAEDGSITLLCKITPVNFDGGFKEPYKSKMKATLGAVSSFLAASISLVRPQPLPGDSQGIQDRSPTGIDWATSKFLREARLVEDPFESLEDLAALLDRTGKTFEKSVTHGKRETI